MRRLPLLLLLATFLSITINVHAQYAEVGYATYYADYLIGNPTAHGEVYFAEQFTCAHKRHPAGTLLKVSRVDDGRSVTVRVNDKGPFKDGYVVDLSKVAGKYIGLDLDGKAKVRLEVVGYSERNPFPADYRPEQNLTARGFSNPQDYSQDPTSYDQINNTINSNSPIQRLQAGLGGFGIQIASYSLEENATRQIKALQEKGVQNLYIKEVETNYTGVMYKLIVARFATREAANQQLQYLRQQSLNGFVTRLD
ncbi:MAG: septal ring lytic transglycosylase RlpA family protein [Bacteroidota bacterium]